jgi:hypothetical protein
MARMDGDSRERAPFAPRDGLASEPPDWALPSSDAVAPSPSVPTAAISSPSTSTSATDDWAAFTTVPPWISFLIG